MRFSPAPEYPVFPTPGPAPEAVRGRRPCRWRRPVPCSRSCDPTSIVADILTLAPALAGELRGIPVATLIPHVHPAGPPGFPLYSIGARLPRTAVGRILWRGAGRGRSSAASSSDAPSSTRPAGASTCRRWPTTTAVSAAASAWWRRSRRWSTRARGRRTSTSSGRCCGSRRRRPSSSPPGAAPLVVVAPSTSQDPDHRLLRAALDGLADLPVRVLATLEPAAAEAAAAGAGQRRARRLVLLRPGDAARRRRGLPRRPRDAGAGAGKRGRGRVLSGGGDMNENAARAAWAGVGVRVPRRLVSPLTVRLAVNRALGEPSIRVAAGALSGGPVRTTRERGPRFTSRRSPADRERGRAAAARPGGAQVSRSPGGGTRK